MPLRWITQPAPVLPEEPKIILAAPGSITPRHRLTQVLAAGSLLAVAFRPLPAAPRHAASAFTVVNLSSGGPGSLSQAVDDANAHAGPDTITFDPSLNGTIALTATLRVTDSVKIQGPGPGKLAVSGGNALRVFYLNSPSSIPFTTTISGLTIRDGRTKANGGGLADGNSTLTLDSVDVLSNTANAGAGVYFTPSGFISASLTITNSLISENVSAGTGGGLKVYYAPAGVTIKNSTIFSNTANSGGGGIEIDKGKSIQIEDSAVLSNTAAGISVRGGGIVEAHIYGSSNVIRRTTISGNQASGSGGGLSLFYASNLLIEDTIIMSNTAGSKGHGGGISDAHTSGNANIIRRTTISGNQAGGPGGGLSFYKTNVTIEDSTIISNTAGSKGAGGGIRFDYLYSATIRTTTIAGNIAPRGAGVWAGALKGPLVIENTTISGNMASNHGGGLSLYRFYSKAIVRNSTIVGNTAVHSGGGVETFYGTLPMTNTIIAGNTITGKGQDITGTFKLRYDLVQTLGLVNLTNAGGNIFGLDPLLGPLADNGGPTKTHMPAHNSPAINAGDPAFAPPPATDQRGNPRVLNGRVDIGAVETLELFLPIIER